MSYSPLFVIGQTDTLPPITANLTDDSGNDINLSTATSVAFSMANFMLGVTITGSASIVNAGTGKVSYSWQQNDTLQPGVYAVEWTVTWSGGSTTTYPVHGYDLVTVLNDLAMGYPNVTPTFNTIWSSTVAPISANGNNGDYWYDTTTGYFYGPKSNGSWPSGFLLNPSLIPLNQIAVPIGSVNMNSQKLTNLQFGSSTYDSVAFGQVPNRGIDPTTPAYGADPTGTNDSTTALQTALNALNAAGGGTLLLGPGKFILSGSSVLQMNSFSNVHIEGVGGFNTAGGTTIVYQGASTADAIQVINSTGCSIKGVSFSGTSSSWTGNYINCATTGDITSNLVIEDCEFINTTTTACTDINLPNVQTARVVNCYFSHGNVGINGATSSLTSNDVVVDGCNFTSMTTDIQNPSTSWTVRSCYLSNIAHTAGVPVSTLLVQGNTFTGGSVAVQVYGTNISVIGNTISATGAGVYIDSYSQGLVVKGNSISNASLGVETIDTLGVDISNNEFISCTTSTSYNATSNNLVTNGYFTSGTTGWSAIGSATLTQLIGDSVGGDDECMSITTNGSALGGANATTFVGVANTTYQASIWVKRISGTGQPVMTIKDTTNNVTGTSSALNTNGAWTRLTASVTTGASTPTIQFAVATTVSTSATVFEIDLATARKGTTLLPELFYFNYLGNVYTSSGSITGSYNQCSTVEDPAGTVIEYGTPTTSSVIYQTSGYDTILGNNLYVPGTTSLTGAVTATGGVSASPTSTSVVPLTANVPSGASVDVADFKVNGTTAWKVGNTGTLTGTQPAVLSPSSTSAVGLTVNNPTSTSVDIADFQINGTTEVAINSSGNLAIKNSKQLDLTSANTSPFLGNASTTYTPTWGADTTNPVLGNGTITGRYLKYGRMVWFSIHLVIGSTTTQGSGPWNFTMPFTPANGSEIVITASMSVNNSFYSGTGQLKTGSTFYIYATTQQLNGIASANPNTWGSGTSSYLSIAGVYESST